MKYLTVIAVAWLALLSSACTTYRFERGPSLQNLSQIPVPRSGGLPVYFVYGDTSDREKKIRDTLIDSGYFSSVQFGGKPPKNIDGYIHVRQHVSDGKSLTWAFSKMASLLTLGVIPIFSPHAYDWWSSKYVYSDEREQQLINYSSEGIMTHSIWPHVLVFGATEDRSLGERSARFTSNLIFELDKQGLLK